ncbi:MAG: hypothetical protein ACTHNW_15075 [Mucilaginibacter sp.]
MSTKSLPALLLAVLLLALPLKGISQTIECGSLRYLVAAKGFKQIVLGEDINNLQVRPLKYLDNNQRPDADSCFSYACSDAETLTIDSGLKLDMVGIRTYKNKIVNIYLFFAEKDAYKVLSNFLKNYGQFTGKPLEYGNVYDWNTQSVKLSLSYNSNVDEGVAVFTFKPLAASIQDTNRKKHDAVTLQAYNILNNMP